MGDLHEGVVHWVYQCVQRLTVCSNNYVVRNSSNLESDVFAAYEVKERHVFIWHAYAQYRFASVCTECRLLLVREVAVVAVVSHCLWAAGCDVACFDFFWCGEGFVHVATVNELLDDVLVDVCTLALAVWPVRAAYVDAFVPVDTQPGQSFDDLLVAFFRVTFRVCVLDAENHLSTNVTCVRPVEQGGTDHSHVRGSGW